MPSASPLLFGLGLDIFLLILGLLVEMIFFFLSLGVVYGLYKDLFWGW